MRAGVARAPCPAGRFRRRRESPDVARWYDDGATDGIVHVSAAALDGLEIEACRRRASVGDGEEDHAAHEMRRSVSSRAADLPFRPYGLAVHAATHDVRRYVRHRAENLFPVSANLLASLKITRGMRGCLVPIIGREAVDECREVMAVRRVDQPVDHRIRVRCPVFHACLDGNRIIGYTTLYLIREYGTKASRGQEAANL